MRKRIKGISLLEIMLSLAIIAIILVMATRYFQQTRLQQQTNEAANQITAVRGAATRWLQSHADYKGIHTVNDLQNLNLLPQNFINPWGNKIDVSAPAGNIIQITLEGIPLNACNNLMDRFASQMVSPAPAACTISSGDKANFLGNFN